LYGQNIVGKVKTGTLHDLQPNKPCKQEEVLPMKTEKQLSFELFQGILKIYIADNEVLSKQYHNRELMSLSIQSISLNNERRYKMIYKMLNTKAVFRRRKWKKFVKIQEKINLKIRRLIGKINSLEGQDIEYYKLQRLHATRIKLLVTSHVKGLKDMNNTTTQTN